MTIVVVCDIAKIEKLRDTHPNCGNLWDTHHLCPFPQEQWFHISRPLSFLPAGPRDINRRYDAIAGHPSFRNCGTPIFSLTPCHPECMRGILSERARNSKSLVAAFCRDDNRGGVRHCENCENWKLRDTHPNCGNLWDTHHLSPFPQEQWFQISRPLSFLPVILREFNRRYDLPVFPCS